MSQDAMIWLSRQHISDISKDVGAEELRVLFCLLGHLSYENHIITPQAEMASKIDMQNSNFSRALKKLIERGIIEKGPKIGRVVSLKITPDFAWKGSAKNHRKILLDKEMSERGLSVILGES